MYCIKCGQQLPDEAQFCCNCGAKTARPTPADEISAKASDFVMNEDISMSGGDLNNDRVAKEATLFGDFPSEPQPQITFMPPLPPQPKRTTPEYNFSRTQSNDDPDLWIVRRDDDLLGLHECRLDNKQSGWVSDWFDDIYYDCNGFYVIRKGSSRGLIDKHIACASLWDGLCGYGLNGREHSIYGFWGVCINDKWAIISLHNGEIKYHSPYVYDNCDIEEEDTVVVKQGSLYGCLLFDKESGILTHNIPCVFDDIGAFSISDHKLGNLAQVKYKSRKRYLNRKGELYKRYNAVNDLQTFIGYLLISAIVIGIAYKMITSSLASSILVQIISWIAGIYFFFKLIMCWIFSSGWELIDTFEDK